MVKYKCLRCGYTNNIKSRFINHLNRKFICEPTIDDISTQEIHDIYFIKINKSVEKQLVLSRTDLHRDNNGFICSYCENSFKHKRSLNRHINSRCKKKDDNSIDFLLNLLKNQLENGSIDDVYRIYELLDLYT